MNNLEYQGSKFSLNDKQVYLNCAYMSPLLNSVASVGRDSIDRKIQPASIRANDFFEPFNSLRTSFSKLVNAQDSDRIVSIPSVSYGIATVANNVKLKKGENIIVLGDAFPSNIYSWKKLCEKVGGVLNIINPPETLVERGKIWNERILNAIDENTKVVAIAHVHWVDGTLFDLVEIRRKTSQYGALLIIDGTQSVGALDFDIQRIKPDALICAGYKWLLGPYSSGLAYYSETFDDGEPIEENWINRFDSHRFENLVNYQDQYRDKAQRFGVGESSNFVSGPMLIESMRQIEEWGVDSIQNYCEKLIKTIPDELESMGYWIEEKDYRSAHLFGIRVIPEVIPRLTRLLEERDIFVSIRGSSIRVSPHVYNTVEDIEALLACFRGL